MQNMGLCLYMCPFVITKAIVLKTFDEIYIYIYIHIYIYINFGKG